MVSILVVLDCGSRPSCLDVSGFMPIFVSILVVLDCGSRPYARRPWRTWPAPFQSLLYWIVGRDVYLAGYTSDHMDVSILVVLDCGSRLWLPCKSLILLLVSILVVLDCGSRP